MYKPSAVNVPIIRLLMKVTILHVKLIIIKLHLQTFRRLLFFSKHRHDSDAEHRGRSPL